MKARYLGLLFVLLITGCDSQSPNAKYIDGDGVSISLLSARGYPLPALDAWWLEDGGSVINAAAFGYKCTIATDGVEVSGIKIVCRIINHSDPWGSGYDIWDTTAPNGEKYGFVASVPPGSWDYEEGIAIARTLGYGGCSFYIGLGSPYPDTIPGFDWPGGCDTMVSTLVEIKFVIPKWNGNIEKECYMWFVRGQCADFREPPGLGVINTSFSYLEKYEDGMYSMSSGEGVTIQLEQVDVAGYTPKTKVKKVETETADPPIREWTPPATLEPNLTSPILHFASTAEPNESWEYIEGWWEQFVVFYDELYKRYLWYWDTSPEDLAVLWMADPCDYQDGVELVSYAEPYAFFCKISLEEIEDVNSFFCTVILKSKDEFGNDAAWLPINMYVYDIEWPYVWLWSTGVVAIEHTAGQGYYIDKWGYPFAVIYVPNNGYLGIEVDDFYGDFNFDGVVNLVDYAMLVKQMGKGLTDEYYNLMYDGDHDGQTDANDLTIFFQKGQCVNLVNFSKFANDWLNGNVDFEDLNNFNDKWLKPSNHNWLKER